MNTGERKRLIEISYLLSAIPGVSNPCAIGAKTMYHDEKQTMDGFIFNALMHVVYGELEEADEKINKAKAYVEERKKLWDAKPKETFFDVIQKCKEETS